jgi:hypothetical protein
MFALVVALFSLLFCRDVFWISAPVVAVVEPAGLVMILASAVLGVSRLSCSASGSM